MKFFEKLPNPDKQFAVMPGIAHASFQQKNYAIVLPHPGELLHAAGADLQGRALTLYVMAGLVPAIHDSPATTKTWMRGPSPHDGESGQ